MLMSIITCNFSQVIMVVHFCDSELIRIPIFLNLHVHVQVLSSLSVDSVVVDHNDFVAVAAVISKNSFPFAN